jgi:prolyl 4-hydroxylase
VRSLLIAEGEPFLKRSIVVDGKEGKTSAPSRTSQSTFLRKERTAWLSDKVAALTGRPPSTHEPAQVCRYESGQQYAAHYDAFDLTSEPGRACAATGGQRIATVLVYLNDVDDGPDHSGTDFPSIGRRILPTRGKALVFFPCTLQGKLDTLALHSGMPVKSLKWVCQVWLRQRDYV